MESTIKILPQFIANRIAAGEVVGRPESVVKELIENSIDANSTIITLRVKDAGKSLIQVTDNGIGMNQEDASLSFQRHSTSKITSSEDLENIITLGFRGEALASISAVAQVEMRTGTSIEEDGTIIKNYGSEIIEILTASGTQAIKGTSLTVKNLFYNTPARRNFLKSNQTEFKHIYDTFLRLAIAHPEISFIFINDDEEIFNLKSSDLRNRLSQLFGVKYPENLVKVDYRNDLISLQGFISKLSFTKKAKQDQILYINKRFVYSKSLSYAVHVAYGDLIEKGDYPSFFLFITIDPHHFDVNVHPSKLEVKFDDEKEIFNFMRKGVLKALETADLTVGVNLNEEDKFSFRNKQNDSNGKIKNYISNKNNLLGIPFEKLTRSNIHEMFTKRIRENIINTNLETDLKTDTQSIDKSKSRTHIDSFASKNSIWQFQKKYILYQLENNLMIIDQHAAHERVLYEQALDRLNSNANLSQQLLIPIYLELHQIDYEIIRSIINELKALGFDIELLSKKIKLIGVPSDVRIGNEEKILQEMIDEFKTNDIKLKLEKRENLAKSYACKHAIKTGDLLKEDEMLNLIDRLFATKVPYVCPHGRPTIIKITMDELDKKFARAGF